MTEKASADDFQAQDFVKKKKRKHKEHDNETHENDESIQTAEPSRASPVLFEDTAAPSDEGCEKKKKKKNKEKPQSLLDNSVTVELEHEISNETGENASPKKKKKKRKRNDSAGEQSDVTCVTVNQHSAGDCQEVHADYVYVQRPLKKEGEKKLPAEVEACELSASERQDETYDKRLNKKKKKKRIRSTQDTQENTDVTLDQSLLSSSEQNGQEEDTELPLPKKKKKRRIRSTQDTQENTDVAVDQSLLSSPEQNRQEEDTELPLPKKKKKRSRTTQDTQENTDVTVDQSLLSPPEQNRQEKDTELPLPKEEGGVAAPQQWHEDGGCDTSVMRDDSTNVPAKFSKSTEAADASPKKSAVCARKVIKSSTVVTEDSSSESDVKTPEPSASKRKKDQNSSVTERAASDEAGMDEEDSLDHTTYLPANLDTVKQELEEFIPHVRNISDSSIKKMAGRDLERFKQFKKQGIAVKFGRFSQKENDQIRKNVEDFLSMTGVDNAEKLLFTSRYPEDKEALHRLKAEHMFCEKLSEGIPRPWRLIYYRARKMFDPNNYKGRYTNEEKEKLKKYHAMHGNNWKKISEMMSRSNLSVAMKYSEIKSANNYGPWSKEETRKLMHAVEEVLRKRGRAEDADSLSSSEKSNRDILIDREKLYQKLPWTEIEAKVGTRYWRQCKQKWITVVTNKMTKGHQLYRGTKGLQAKINLIKRLHEMKVEDANEVNWEELSNIIGNVPRAYVQAKFYKLKVSCVPFWQKKTFSEIIDYLFEKKIPELEEKLRKKERKRRSSDNLTAMEQRKTFRLSDIFDSSEESD